MITYNIPAWSLFYICVLQIQNVMVQCLILLIPFLLHIFCKLPYLHLFTSQIWFRPHTQVFIEEADLLSCISIVSNEHLFLNEARIPQALTLDILVLYEESFAFYLAVHFNINDWITVSVTVTSWCMIWRTQPLVASLFTPIILHEQNNPIIY